MNYKEIYDAALERAAKLRVQNPFDTVGQMVEYIFPELKESEDEKIRKRIIDILENDKKHYLEEIAWLEKQRERKPADKVEPKFHEGDWITNGDYNWRIVDVKPLDYTLQSQDGNVVNDDISYVDKHFHLWTIQDAENNELKKIESKKLDTDKIITWMKNTFPTPDMLINKFKCDKLDWHIPEDTITYTGGTNFKSKCKYCGRPILWSSGGWFSYSNKRK